VRKLLILASNIEQVENLSIELAKRDFKCSVICDAELTEDIFFSLNPDLMLISIISVLKNQAADYLTNIGPRGKRIPVIVLAPLEFIDSINALPNIDDFVLEPWHVSEVAVRSNRIIHHKKGLDSENSIICDNLTIDLNNCEVTVDDRPIALTFKEYELMKFLASNRGRVYSREDLLNEVWGYEYYGGYRTVDVHIRRLRGKIEDSDHTFIETVRNIGYRFIKSS